MRQLSKVNFSVLILCDLWELFGCIWSLWKCLYTTFLFFIFVNENFPSSTSMNLGLRSSHLNTWYSLLYLYLTVSIFHRFYLSQTHNNFSHNLIWECYPKALAHNTTSIVLICISSTQDAPLTNMTPSMLDISMLTILS